VVDLGCKNKSQIYLRQDKEAILLKLLVTTALLLAGVRLNSKFQICISKRTLTHVAPFLVGTVWNIEKEQAVGRLTLQSEYMVLGSYNPLNKLIFTAMNDSDQKVVALFDKNLQNVAKLENCKEASVDRFCFVDEYTSVLTSDHSYSSIWDLRMPDRPRQFINLTV
jgi:hypothetical protein